MDWLLGRTVRRSCCGVDIGDSRIAVLDFSGDALIQQSHLRSSDCPLRHCTRSLSYWVSRSLRLRSRSKHLVTFWWCSAFCPCMWWGLGLIYLSSPCNPYKWGVRLRCPSPRLSIWGYGFTHQQYMALLIAVQEDNLADHQFACASCLNIGLWDMNTKQRIEETHQLLWYRY